MRKDFKYLYHLNVEKWYQLKPYLYGPGKPYRNIDLSNIGPGNVCLLPDGIKPLPEPMLTCHQSCSVTIHIHLKAISQEVLEVSIWKVSLIITFSRTTLHLPGANELTLWGWVTHICVNELTIIGSDNSLWPGWHQAIIWTNAAIMSIRPFGTNFSEILIEKFVYFHSRKCIWKYRQEIGCHFVSASMCWSLSLSFHGVCRMSEGGMGSNVEFCLHYMFMAILL